MKKKLALIYIFIIGIFNLMSLDINMDTNNDAKDDRWLKIEIDKDWKLLDINQNDKPDETCFYISDKNIVYFIKEEKYDYSGNGKANIWIKYSKKGKNYYTEITADEDEDGKNDLIVKKKNDIMYLKQSDTNNDGIIDMEEQYVDGQKVKESIDSNKDGKMDDYYTFENDVLMSEEIDSNFNGKPDLWVVFNYNEDKSLKECIIKKDNNHDGKVDEWHYSDNKRRIIRIEKDTNFDGEVDSIKNLK